MRGFVDAVNRLSLACAVLAAVFLSIAILIICYMVLIRSLGSPTHWEVEVSIYLTVAATFLASPYTLHTGGHVAVDLWTSFLPKGAARAVHVVLALVGMAVCLYLAWVGLRLAIEAFASDERSISMFRPPTWPLYAMLPLGTGLTALQYVADLVGSAAPAAATERDGALAHREGAHP
jgi:TRAP-type C4-dicarboxylate transport system permease small subunit